ncbi:MIP/aquaporin family protein [Erythrobacter sp. T5W1-R]|uniref:MIP/aquaporin family protein n=1 Tax=Erythrobacter sp. T5W1-R TaxID=3101752 RepID=UPI002AFEA8C3|nr:MIP/aquaporin family protein [Erythrobacter sp. T5W1-R]MEA1619991.1 MIP/aquaporin family protein [Erythrobacter sp. T5W1-R]
MIGRLLAEALGTFFLFATVMGAGIMADNLAGGNVAVALIGTTLPIGAILYVIIVMLGPVSGAHFNPVVTLVFRLRGEIENGVALAYVITQVASGILAAFAVHLMFDLPILQVADTPRTGIGQWAGEVVATFGLILTILATLRARPDAVPISVALYIFAACWFTSSTSFANPAITIARSFTDTFTGIAPADIPAFVIAQIAGALLAMGVAAVLFAGGGESAGEAA